MDLKVKERLEIFCKSQRISKREFERRIGASNGFASNIYKGIGAEKMSAIKKEFPDLNPTWLLYGEGDMYIGDNNTNAQNVASIENNNGTFNQGTPQAESATNEEKSLYKKVIELLEAKVKQLEDEKSAFLNRHGCKSLEEIDWKMRSIIDDEMGPHGAPRS